MESKADKSKRMRKSGWMLIGISFLSSGGILSSILYKASLIESVCFKNQPVKISGFEFTIPAVTFILGLILVAHEFFLEVVKAWRK